MKNRLLLSLVMPVHNERVSLPVVIEEWSKELERHHILYEIVISEDGSTDGTQQLLRTLRKRYPLRLDIQQSRRGYGQAVIDGIKNACGEYLLSIDSDGQCSPADFSSFWSKRDFADVLIGRRTLRQDHWTRKLYSRLFYSIFVVLFPTDIHDPSAPYVLYKKSLVLPYLSQLAYLREGFWWGFVGMCVKNKLHIREMPIQHRPRISGITQVYQAKKMPGIIVRNIVGLVKLRFV